MKIKIRGLMVLIVLGAFAYGIAVDRQTRSERNQAASGETHLLGQVAIHERGLAECRRRMGGDYDWFDREAILKSLPYQHPNFSRWDEEAAWHEKMIANRRRVATDYALLKDHIQQRLLFP